MTRVLVADDHPVFRDGLAMLLGSVDGIEVVGTAANGREAVESAVRLRPDVVVMDVQMPELNGVDATRRLVTEAPGVGILVLTMSEDDGTVFATVRAGARGYLVKGAECSRSCRWPTAPRRSCGPGRPDSAGSPAGSGGR